MGTEENVALFRRFVDEVINNHNLEAIDALMAEDFVEHEELPPGIPAGREGVKALFTALRTGFPDLKAQIEDSIAQDDKVTLRMTWRGTQTGQFLFISPTNKQVTFSVIDIVRVADGKVVEHWGLLDQFSVFQQLGVIPAPQAP